MTERRDEWTDFPAEETPGINLFFKDEAGGVFHAYSTFGRGERDVPNKTCPTRWSVRSRDGAQVRHAFLPIGIGHVASVAIMAFAFAQGMSMDRGDGRHRRVIGGIPPVRRRPIALCAVKAERSCM